MKDTHPQDSDPHGYEDVPHAYLINSARNAQQRTNGSSDVAAQLMTTVWPNFGLKYQGQTPPEYTRNTLGIL